jgi:hypothetical protein
MLRLHSQAIMLGSPLRSRAMMRVAFAVAVSLSVCSPMCLGQGSPLILNEYNAVGPGKMLADDGRDTHFGRVAGNGGNWIELVVTRDGVDLRGWKLDWTEKAEAGTLVLSDDPLWTTLRAGTILTLIDRDTKDGGLDTDTSFDPEAGDWWINICTRDARYIISDASSPGRLNTGNDDFTLTIRNAAGELVFGPCGEGAGVWTGGGVNSQEGGALQADPSPAITPESPYSDVNHTSFGAPNRWIEDERELVQDFGPLRRGEVRAPMPAHAAPAPRDDQPWLAVKTLATIDVPGWTCEIVAYCASQRLLLSTNGMWKTLDVYRVASLDPPVIEPIDFDPELPGAQGIWVSGGDPTSVAVHPTQPIAVVVALSAEPFARGWVHGYDLREESLGRLVFSQQVGYHPDCVAISPDGRWVIIANEGEGHPDNPGSIGLLRIEGVTADRRPYHPGVTDLPYHEVSGLAKLLDTRLGDIEPEYVAVDPQSRFAAVSCQENDAVVLVDLRGESPSLAGVVWLPYGSEPDGIALIDDIAHPDPADGRTGVVLGVAEEGKFDPWKGKWLGNCVSFHWLDPSPDKLGGVPVPLARVDVRPLIDPSAPDRRRDPESIRFARFGRHVAAVVGIERGDRLLVLDVTDFTQPTRISLAKVGIAPEGLTLVPHDDGYIAITGDEGKADGPGTISFVRLSPRTTAHVSSQP